MKKSTNIKYGDIIKLGVHTIACGKAEDKELVKKLIGEEKIDLILSDPPYGVDVVQSKKGFCKLAHAVDIANDHFQTDKEYSEFTFNWLNAVKPYLAKKNSAYIFNSDKMIFALREGMLKAGFKFSQLLTWIKSQAIIGRLNYLPMSEFVAVAWFGTHKFYKSQDKSVLFYPKAKCSRLHSSMKPCGLLRRLILNSSQINAVVYDPFLGSGSTLIASEQTKRKCIGIELSPEYCQTIVDRYNNLKK